MNNKLLGVCEFPWLDATRYINQTIFMNSTFTAVPKPPPKLQPRP